MVNWLSSKLGQYLVLAATIIMAVAAIFFKGKKAGKDEAKATQLEGTVKAVKEARRIEQDTATLSDADVDKRLSKYYRD